MLPRRAARRAARSAVGRASGRLRGVRARYAELGGFMDDARATKPTPRLDERLPARALARTSSSRSPQRLEQVGRSARVISFPGAQRRAAQRRRPRRGIAPRWMAAAAAAGLFVGVAVGAVLSTPCRGIDSASTRVATPRRRGASASPSHRAAGRPSAGTPTVVDTDDCVPVRARARRSSVRTRANSLAVRRADAARARNHRDFAR